LSLTHARTHARACVKLKSTSILRELKKHPNLRLLEVRGFRVISGGLLRPLENYHWWWKFNRRIGALVPAACIEIQVVLTKIRPD
jgi:hypothetical protein